MKLSGTYKLISNSRRILDTGEEVSAFGKNAKGSIIYGDDGRFLVLIINDGRPKPESIEALTDQQRADLHRTMSAYGGTYAFDGETVEHHVELAWNEVWAGTTVIRDVKVEGNRVTYTSRPAPFGGDGKTSVITVVWEKVE